MTGRDGMAVTNDQVAALRALLRGDQGEYERFYARLGKNDGIGYAAMIGAAFIIAAERRFQPGGTTADVIHFVADARSHDPGIAQSIDPKTGERLVLSALTDEPVDDIDAKTATVTELLLLAAMTAAEDFHAADLDSLLEEARALVDE